MTADGGELLLFQVGARVYAAPVGGVARVGAVRDVAPEELVEGTSLGAAFGRERGLVLAGQAPGAEATLVVDQVLGIRTPGAGELHPLPPLAAAVLGTAAVTGLALLDGTPTILIDLPTLVRERRAAPGLQP